MESERGLKGIEDDLERATHTQLILCRMESERGLKDIEDDHEREVDYIAS